MSFSISLEAITKYFDEQPIFKNLSLNIESGTSNVLVGPAASGKSLLLKCILGLSKIDSGDISINGRYGINRLKQLDNIGVMFQENALFDSLTIWENIVFKPLNQKRFSKEKGKSIAKEQLEQVKLSSDTLNKYPSELSGGMQKRVALARALLNNPKILFLDEPTAGLDPILTNVICQLIKEHAQRYGTTVVAVTSNMNIARTEFDHIHYLANGYIQWSGSFHSSTLHQNSDATDFLQS